MTIEIVSEMDEQITTTCEHSVTSVTTALFNRFAHSAGPGMVRHRAVWIGIGMDDLMRSSKGQEGTGR